ncbi:MAG: pyridoxal-phosphate dependent enzyme [Firmicutes bacterium]|nr:pyridoxal-phosphate dependent enzyme [Bacillota bacterium]
MITLADIWEARNRIQGRVHKTDTIPSNSLGDMTGSKVFIKAENFQKAGSFKVRGAFNKILSLPEEKRAKGVIAFSSGNHAQAVAYAARALKIPATVVMPPWANPIKLKATRAYGARVVLYGQTSLDMASKAMEIKENESLELVHPFDDPMTIAGQGTIGLEILGAVPDINSVYVAIGGGGLIGGIALAIKSISPRTKIIGVQPVGSCSMLASRRAGRVTEIDQCVTIADGLVAKKPGENTFLLADKYVDEIITVEDEAIKAAMLYLLERMKLLVEPSGAVSLAGLLSGSVPLGPKSLAVLSGGNCDPGFLGSILLESSR